MSNQIDAIIGLISTQHQPGVLARISGIFLSIYFIPR